MAANNRKITLTLDFNVEKTKLQEISSLINKDLGKGLSSGKGGSYFNNITHSVVQATKEAGQLYKMLSKPLVSQSQVKSLGSSLEGIFDKLDDKLLSFQGNLAKSFNSVNNVETLKQIRTLGNEITKLAADYQKVTQLNAQIKSLGNKSEINKQVNAANKELNALSKKEGALSKAEIKRQTELNKIVEEGNKKLQEKLVLQEKINAILQSNQVSTPGELKGKMDDAILEQNNLTDASLSQADLNTLKTLLNELRILMGELKAVSKNTTIEMVDDFGKQDQAMLKAEQQAQSFKNVLRSLGISFSLDWVINELKRVARYSYEYIKNLDRALTEISVVSGKTRAEVMGLTDTFIELSAKTGMAIDDIAQASTIYYQQGLGDEAVKQLTEYTAIFAKISGETVQTAADQITAAINGFGFAASEAGKVIDKMSVLAAYSAADIDELATAMSKGASQAAMAGLSFDEYNAYLATMIETTREAPENLGTSLKTIMSRFQSIKTGENTEDDTDVNAVEKALKTVGVQLRDSTGQLRDLGEVLDDLGPKWNSLDRNTQAYLGTTIAGTRQQSRFISLMQNWDRALELTEASQNSAGAATRMHAAAMEGLDASLNNLTNSWQKLISSLADGDSIKWLIDGLTGLVKWLGDGNSLLKIMTIAVTALNIKTLVANAGLLKQQKDVKNLNVVFGNLSEAITGTIKTYKGLGDAQSVESQKIDEQNRKIEEQIRLLKEQIALKKQSLTQTEANPDGVTPINAQVASGEKLKKNVKESNNLIDQTDNKVGKTTKKAGKLKTGLSNITSLVGSIQMGIGAALAITSLITTIIDIVTTTSDEIREKAQTAYDETQKEIDSRSTLAESVEANIEVYDRLNRKLNKSTEEVNQLADAANALAEAAPGALIGYDSKGNPIIDTTAAKAESAKAKKELAEYAKTQMSNIGNLARADLREQAEKDWAASDAGKANSNWQTAGKVATFGGLGVLGTVGSALLVAPEPVVTKVTGAVLIAAAALTTLGATIWGTTEHVKKTNISSAELALAQEKATEINKKYSEDMLKNMQYITNQQIADRTVNGVSEDARTVMASYIGNEWLQNKRAQIMSDSFTEDGKFDAKKYEELYNKIGQDWEDTLKRINDVQLAKSYEGINQIADGIGEKTYKSVEDSITEIIKSDLGITEDDPLFETIKTAFFKAAYSGTDMALYSVLEDLEARKKEIADVGGDTSSYDTAIASAKNMTSNELNTYSSLGITDNINLFNDMVSQYGGIVKEALVRGTQNGIAESIAILEQFKTTAQAKIKELEKKYGVSSYLEIDRSKLSSSEEALINYYESIEGSIEKGWNSLKVSSSKTWDSLLTEYEKITEKTEKVRTTLASLTSGEGIDYNQWKEFVSVLDEMDTSAFDPTQVLKYADAVDKVAESLYVENGMLYANADAISTIADLEEMLADIQIQNTKQQLINKKAELQVNKAVIDAQIAYLKYQIAEAEGAANASELKKAADESWVNASNKMNAWYSEKNQELTETTVSQWSDAFAAIGDKYNKLMTGLASGEISKKTRDDLMAAWKNAKASIKQQVYTRKDDETDEEYIAGLKATLEDAEAASANYAFQIANINLQIANLNSGVKKTQDGIKSSSKALDEYISKLEKFLKLLRHIEREEANLNIAKKLADMQSGKAVINRLENQLTYIKHLMGDTFEMYNNYEKEANAAAVEIRKGFGDMVSFDEWGNYDVDMAAYSKLGDKHKELLDDSLKAYDELISQRDKYYEGYLDYTKEQIEINQSMIDKYIDAEDKLVEAIKQREQKILDNKLAAIDKEIEAIEKAAEARRKAREEEKEAQELSSMQVDLQRALMDSSGASATQILDIQKQIKEKQQEMADDSFDTMVEDMQTQLEEEKEMEQQLFDERLEEMDWYWEEVDRIMSEGTDSVLDTMQQYLDSFNQSSELQQTELLKGWTDTFEQALYIGKNGASSLQDLVASLQQEANKLLVDEDIITSSTINTAFNKRPEVKEDKASTSTSGGGNKTTSSNTNKTNNVVTKTEINDKTENNLPDADINPGDSSGDGIPDPSFASGKKVKTKEKFGYVSTTLFDDADLTQRSNKKGYTASKTVGGGTSGLLINGASFTTGKQVYYKGQWYYQVTDNGWLGSKKSYIKGLQLKYKRGGMVYQTGPAWLDGTSSQPEAVLNAMQTKAFLSFTDDLAALRAEGGTSTNSSVVIDNISFNVESMSSVADGEKAFNAFVDKFKEIGAKQGISILGTANRN